MRKSLGNLVLVRDLLRTYTGDAIRLYLVSHHYRDELTYRPEELKAAAARAARLRLASVVVEGADRSPAPGPHVAALRDGFLAAMDDDLDTPRAMPLLYELADLALDEEHPGDRAEASAAVREL